MSLQSRMEAKKQDATIRESVRKQLYKNEKSFRAAQAIDAWSKIPIIGAGLKNLPLKERENVALNLNAQAGYMSRLSEAQLSDQFQNFAPQNMLRLVRLTMPAVCRNKVFTEFAMESAKDSIKYIKPVYSKTQNGKDLNDKHSQYANETDPWGYENGSDVYNSNNFQGKDYRKAAYETTEDRASQELIAYPFVNKTENTESGTGTGATYLFTWDVDNATEAVGKGLTLTSEEAILTAEKFANGSKIIRGYSVVYGKDETDVIAVEENRSGKFMFDQNRVSKVAFNDNGELEVVFTEAPETTVTAFVRVDLEADFEGDSLGEIQLIPTDYEFRPRPTTIGVSWSQLAEITVDASYGISMQDLLVEYAAEAIRVNLDYRSFKMAYQIAKTNGANYYVTFTASNKNSDGVIDMDHYIHNAQTIISSIDTLSDSMLNEINRGGVSRIVAGPSAGTYLRLSGAFDAKGRQANIGIHQVGELEGIPVFKAPSSIIPTDEMLCVWKNDANEGDVAIAFGTLVPFMSTGVIQRKNFYKEAGLASYGDYKCLNQKYLGIIKILGLKDITKN